MSDPTGDGPGDTAPDGSAVELYARLPPGSDPELLHSRMPPGANILDLGAGTGRLADPLVDLGHPVLAVDASPTMLARVRSAATLTSSIQDLHLPQRFDAVLLASHLINSPTKDLRRDLLSSVERHLLGTGQAFIEWHPPSWFDALDPERSYTGTIGDFTTTLEIHSLAQGLLHATVAYQDHRTDQTASTWRHTFTAQRLTRELLQAEADAVGLTIGHALPGAEHWLIASPRPGT
ncbi:class I SAM-dependent methyltransferase [Streptomyces sp. NP160]|uniref:class I SAM-dependent methyltransferase n=1 Tax=Streptomyces sp. NP160 TaxID=2586637 RepID=UPI00111B46B7|nr:class I SAM-dependent methyltransferase [Streptomyces sp. NP160]TNM61934.1 class I SAM-dependent methyltransferase [Streptomyces sp. NP160]